ncbi:MAG: phage holin family protein [Clostridia bacterium]
MNRTHYLIELCCISGIIGIISRFLGDIQSSYIVLLTLIVVDTLTGLAAAIKLNRFSSLGLAKFIKKVITYSLSIATVRLLEIGTLVMVETNILSFVIISFLEVIEAVSVLENLALLGVPISARFINILLGHLRIPWLKEALRMGSNNEKEIKEVEEILKYHVPTFEDKNMRRLLEIKFIGCKQMIQQLHKTFQEVDTKNSQLLYYRTVSLIQLELDEVEEQWEKSNIPRNYITAFNTFYMPKIDHCQEKIKRICFSSETIENKKEQIMDSIRIIMYQTIFDAHKSERELSGEQKD